MLYSSTVLFVLGGENAALGQFPWMTLLGYKQQQLEFIEYLCGGTIISECYILTAAHCLEVSSSHELVHARMGEYDLYKSKDCVFNHKRTICSNDPVDVPVASYFAHPNYDPIILKNDIGLVKLKYTVDFTRYIQPICLPFGRNLGKKNLADEKLFVSGWGKTNSKKLGGSAVLQFASVKVWDPLQCNKAIPSKVQSVSNTQLCANGKKEDACKGDSGGPLFNLTIDTDGDLISIQVGIVSFSPTVTCGIEELPTIYTRVDQYLEWIIENV